MLLCITITKCMFLEPAVEYLGHRADAESLHTKDGKRKSKCESLTIVGKFSHYNIAAIVLPPPSGCQVEVGFLLCQAFDSAKKKPLAHQVSSTLQSNLSSYPSGDASAYGLGATISH